MAAEILDKQLSNERRLCSKPIRVSVIIIILVFIVTIVIVIIVMIIIIVIVIIVHHVMRKSWEARQEQVPRGDLASQAGGHTSVQCNAYSPVK